MNRNTIALPHVFLFILTTLSAQAELGRDWERMADELPFRLSSYARAIHYDGDVWIVPGRLWHSSNGTDWFEGPSGPGWGLIYGNAFTSHDDGIYSVGGVLPFQSGPVFADFVWKYSGGDRWTKIIEHAPWSGGGGHAAASFKGEIWLLGGRNKGNDVWRSPDGVNWTQALEHAPWRWRSDHAAVVHDGKLWVLGGYGYEGTPTTSATIDVNLARDAEVIGPIDPDSIDYNWRVPFTVYDEKGLYQSVYIYFAKVRNGDPQAPEPTNSLWEWRVQESGYASWDTNHLLDIDLGGTLEFNAEGWLVSSRQYPVDTDEMETDHFFELNFGDPINQGGTGRQGTRQYYSNFIRGVVEADDGSSSRVALNDVWSTEDGVNWTESDTSNSFGMWEERVQHSAFTHDGRIWVVGGYDSPNSPDIVYRDIWYSADGENWRQSADDLPWLDTRYHASFSLGEYLWIVSQGYGDQAEDGIWRSKGIPWLTIVNQPQYAKGKLWIDHRAYEDRDYTFRDPMPYDLEGETCIRTLNDHKNSSGDDCLILEVDRPVTVYVAHDARFPNPPSWLQDWAKRDDQRLFTTDPEDEGRILYHKEFPAGTITLGGNVDPGTLAWQSMYCVIVVPGEEPSRADENWARFR